jgi:2'-hydroxyisoflavone reductase
VQILMLGGTAFIGRHLVEAAVARGHEPTLFTRGLTNPGIFPGVERIEGDRERDLARLGDRSFDAVIDTSGYLPGVVRRSAELLADRVELYVFLSSISVYRDAPRLTETTPLQHADDPSSEDVNADYGPLKALCEQEVEAALPGRALVVRPGLVVGRHDYTGRFGYWPRRVEAGGEVLAPGDPATRVWVIDVRDLAEWVVRMVERRAAGFYNAAGPGPPLTMAGLLDSCKAVTRSNAAFTWVTDDFLLRNGVLPYTELPLWVPAMDGGYPEIDVSKAVAAGLTFRPVSETILSTLGGDEGFDAITAGASGLTRRQAGLDPDRERALLADWHAR